MHDPFLRFDRRHADRANLSRRSLLRGAAGGVAAAALTSRGLDGVAAQSATPDASPVAASPASSRFAVGSFAVSSVLDGTLSFPNPLFQLPPQQVFFTDASADELEAALRESGRGNWIDDPANASETGAVTPVVIDTGQHVVLIDTGLGAASPFPGTGLLLASLEAAGYAAADVDTVFFTHGHADHVLGAVDAAGAPAFPNARYVMAAGEFNFWTDQERLAQIFPTPEAAEEAAGPLLAILPAIEKRLELVDEAAGAEIVPGLRTLASYGHTPGHTAVLVESDGEGLLVVGDAFTHPLHVTYPDWNFITDTLPTQTDITRRGLLDRAADDRLLVQVAHVPFPSVGRVVPDGDRYRWEPVG